MLDTDLILDERRLLHDSGEGYSTSNPFYTDDEIIDSLESALTEVIQTLKSSPKVPYVTLGRILKICPATGTAPTDFQDLVCGFKNDGTYVPAVSIRIGEAMASEFVDQVYVKARSFQGNADSALYWAKPSQHITTGGVPLTEFADYFFHAVKYHAALSLLMKENADIQPRAQQIAALLQEKLSSFS